MHEESDEDRDEESEDGARRPVCCLREPGTERWLEHHDDRQDDPAAGVPEIQVDHGPGGRTDEKCQHEAECHRSPRIKSSVLMLMQSVAQEIHDEGCPHGSSEGDKGDVHRSSK